MFNSAVVEVGLLPVNINVTENVTFPVCVEISNGTLGRNITILLIVESGTAVGKISCESDHNKLFMSSLFYRGC